MRTLSEAMAALLKSRKQIGDNKPSCEVSISGLSGGVYDFLTADTAYQPKTIATAPFIEDHSWVELADGRILYMYSKGSALYQGYVADIETFITQDDSFSTEIPVLSDRFYPRATVFFAPNGGLYFIIVYTNTSEENIAKVQLYESALKDGTDWALATTIQSVAWDGGSKYFDAALTLGITVPVFIGSKWVVGMPSLGVDSGYIYAKVGYYTSEDAGATFTQKGEFGYGALGVSNTYVSRNFGMIDGEIWSFLGGEMYHAWKKYIKSTDGGETWEIAFDNDGVVNGSDVLFSDSKYLYRSLWVDANGIRIYRSTVSPTSLDDFEYLLTLPNTCNATRDNNVVYIITGENIIAGGRNGGTRDYNAVICGGDVINSIMPVKSIAINRNKNMAASLELVIDNKDGAWSPDGIAHKEVLWPNKVVTIKQGYGAELVNTFKGLIDRIEMTTFPQELKLTCRDYTKYLLDQLVTKAVEGGNTHVLQYTAQTVEYIVTDLVTEAGLTLAETVYTTGITVDDITFSWCSWADAIQELADLCGADFGCDEVGKFYFRKDYIPDTPTIAYVFQEGEDIISLGYTIDDADIYQKVVCYGTKTDGTSCFAQTNYTSRVYYNVLPHKYMKIDAGTSAQTIAAAQALTDRAEILMRSRVRICQFAAVAVPQLQIGDVIQVIESSSTISEAYRVTDLSTTMDDTYTMMITCYHHSYTE